MYVLRSQFGSHQSMLTFVCFLQGIQSLDAPVEAATAFKDADPTQLDRLVEGTTAWLASSNFKGILEKSVGVDNHG